MKTNILSPFFKDKNSSTFYINGRTFELNNDNLTETEHISNTLKNAINAFESFEFLTNKINWYNGSSQFEYLIKENTFKVNGIEIKGSFTNHVLQAGLVRYNNKNKSDLFESLPSLIENFIVLDFVASFNNKNINVDLFKINETVYVSRFNSETKIARFFKADSANTALDIVFEETQLDASSFLLELLEGESKTIADINAKIESYEDMVSFLKDQRGLLAEADKSIAEIKAADILINEEILNWKNKIAELKK